VTNAVPVNLDNFIRAETDRALSLAIQQQDAFGKFNHLREPAPLDRQPVPRINRDTLYSSAVFDLDAGPVTITMPDPGARFMTLMVVDEDHYVHGVYYGSGAHILSKDKIGTRYVLAAVRTLADPNDPNDLKTVHALQDGIKFRQSGGPGRFEIPNWDPASQAKIREALLVLNTSLPDFRHAFGSRGEVDPVRHLIVTASAWGGNPERDATYFNLTPVHNDGVTIHRLRAKDVPVDSFWSITVYNAEGYLQPNPLNAYNVNSVTAKKDADGSVTIQFGGCDTRTPNCLPIMPGWNATVRLYRPRTEILNGKWKFPEPVPVGAAKDKAA